MSRFNLDGVSCCYSILSVMITHPDRERKWENWKSKLKVRVKEWKSKTERKRRNHRNQEPEKREKWREIERTKRQKCVSRLSVEHHEDHESRKVMSWDGTRDTLSSHRISLSLQSKKGNGEKEGEAIRKEEKEEGLFETQKEGRQLKIVVFMTWVESRQRTRRTLKCLSF